MKWSEGQRPNGTFFLNFFIFTDWACPRLSAIAVVGLTLVYRMYADTGLLPTAAEAKTVSVIPFYITNLVTQWLESGGPTPILIPPTATGHDPEPLTSTSHPHNIPYAGVYNLRSPPPFRNSSQFKVDCSKAPPPPPKLHVFLVCQV
jgi:hypothetical protein